VEELKYKLKETKNEIQQAEAIKTNRFLLQGLFKK